MPRSKFFQVFDPKNPANESIKRDLMLLGGLPQEAVPRVLDAFARFATSSIVSEQVKVIEDLSTAIAYPQIEVLYMVRCLEGFFQFFLSPKMMNYSPAAIVADLSEDDQ